MRRKGDFHVMPCQVCDLIAGSVNKLRREIEKLVLESEIESPSGKDQCAIVDANYSKIRSVHFVCRCAFIVPLNLLIAVVVVAICKCGMQLCGCCWLWSHVLCTAATHMSCKWYAILTSRVGNIHVLATRLDSGCVCGLSVCIACASFFALDLDSVTLNADMMLL